uniref:Uncharacterized protein TCIL3000_11_9770 n=1 Tax=Trypanosoma congolense (strain IL3000) TaxID=1068625 RepID=G0V1I9_TRYCI|nr:unnamed protein product [Trypanosoma congolense IL3000]
MEWVPCTEEGGSLGIREGHCAASLTAVGGGDEWVLCVAGYCQGERDGAALAARTRDLPLLRWFQLSSPGRVVFECDGASLTRVKSCIAYFFGGLDGDMNYSNRLLGLSLHCGTGGAPALQAVELLTSGDVPSPRARHSAGGGENCFVVFGGETDTSEQTNDTYLLNIETFVWTRVEVTGQVPSPRLLAGPLIFLAPHLCVLYGGAYFLNGDIKSLADVWTLRTYPGSAWRPLSGLPGWEDCSFPKSNGHTGGVLSSSGGVTVAAFVGGKDSAEGCDLVKKVRLNSTMEDDLCLCLVRPALPGSEGPHWRYTAAATETVRGLLLLGGQCRHPQDVAAFLLRSTEF